MEGKGEMLGVEKFKYRVPSQLGKCVLKVSLPYLPPVFPPHKEASSEMLEEDLRLRTQMETPGNEDTCLEIQIFEKHCPPG